MLNRKGFTIVELLIVIVVIAILAAITIVVYGGVQTRAKNASRAAELRSWQKQYEMYKATYGDYPAMADGGYCLGKGFPIGYGGVARCRDANLSSNSYLQSDADSLMTELQKVGTLPGGDRTLVGVTVGPYAVYSSTNIFLRGTFAGSSSADCPASASFNYTDGSTYVLCNIILYR